MDNDLHNDDVLLAKWLSGELKGKALQEFEASTDFELYKKIAATSVTLKVPEINIATKLAQQKTYNATLQKTKTSKTIKLKLWLWSAAAAIAILFATILLQNNNQTVTTDLAETQTHVLPDGSIINLNADSSITYDSDHFLETRTLQLEGEAYFKVKKGSAFTVKSSTGSVQVLGTAFNVYDRDKNFKVHCNEGKVYVTTQGKEVTLTEGMSAFAKAKTPLTLVQNTAIIPTWRDGKSNFTNTSLTEVFDEIERQFNVIIEGPQIDMDRTFTGFFSYEKLDNALYQVCIPMNIKYAVIGRTVQLNN